ncbi:MAG: DUF2130 domain-containing protein [Sedimentisphaerales bacterium]
MMTKRNFKCPVCGKPLSQTEYDKALGLWAEKQEHIQHLEAEQKQLRDQARRDREKVEAERRKLQQQAQAFKSEQAKLRAQNEKALAEQAQKAEQLLRQQREQIEKTMQRRMKTQIQEGVNKGIAQQKNEIKKKEVELRKNQNKMKQLENSLKLSTTKFELANDEIRRLKEQIEKGVTPQIEGLLEENKLLAKLTELFPRDKFEHLGKGGDIIQIVIEQGREIGRIVYECKKVKHFDKKHIEQAKEARRIRHADFAILVTNAFPSKKQYYFVEKAVFVISPVSLEPIIQTLRDSLVRISILRMSNEAKEKAVQQVYDYLSSKEYANKVNDVATQLLDLGRELKNEVATHKRIWEKRYHIYQALFNDIGVIDHKLRSLVHGLTGSKQPKLLPAPQKAYIEIDGLGS